jgi:hypothetical protein
MSLPQSTEAPMTYDEIKKVVEDQNPALVGEEGMVSISRAHIWKMCWLLYRKGEEHGAKVQRALDREQAKKSIAMEEMID